MAKPIKETPILTRRDAADFFQQPKRVKDKKNSVTETDKFKTNAERLKTIFR